MPRLEPFGQVAVKMGFCTQEDVRKALEVQRSLSLDGKEHRLIGLILLEAGALSTTQLIQILKYYEHGAQAPQLEDETALG